MTDYTEVRVRELETYGDWPWRYVVEGLTAPRMEKPWPWSRTLKLVAPSWERLRHGVRDFRPCDASDASKLAAHYRKRVVAPQEDFSPFSQEAKIPTEQSDEGVVVLQTARGPIEVDASIAPLVAALNAAGFETKASCSGHGHRPGNIALRDGRELIIARNWCEGRRIDTLFPIASSGERMCEDGLPCPVPDLPEGYRCDGCDCERAAQ